ncbi:hypothetical protein JRQ81_016373 [Phrynocephalus forsythii]|uniref:M-phase phosphoprotein 6 n=1 Tax=Phrynocephalus forsythii TaxID=171643 RepID=A0A9Q0XVE4_9SAUR|nr:hypothetical protein JRQ81_016373 [Phrynocephalus forsythii]
MARDVKSKWSKNLLRMKFMQRGLDEKTKKQLEEEEKKIISNEHWFLDLQELKEKESLYNRRKKFWTIMSFKGFNPEVEKLMIQMNLQHKMEETGEAGSAMEADVSDEEMARRYETLVGTIGKKFLKKRECHVLKDTEEDENSGRKPSKMKKTFLKPQV